MKLLRTCAAAAAALCCAALPLGAHATLALQLTDGTSTLTIADGGLGDSNPAAGAITFIGGIGVFSFTVSTAFGDAVTPFMGLHLDSITASTGGGTLSILMSETGLNFNLTGPTGISTSFGGVAGGTIRGRTYVDDSDVLFGLASNVYDSGALGPGAFAASGWGPTSLTDPFSMTMRVDVLHPGAAVSSFNMESKVPEPATLALFGVGLAGLAATRRRRFASA